MYLCFHTWGFPEVVRCSSERYIPDVTKIVNKHISNILEIRSRRCSARIQIFDNVRITPSGYSNVNALGIFGRTSYVIVDKSHIINLKILVNMLALIRFVGYRQSTYFCLSIEWRSVNYDVSVLRVLINGTLTQQSITSGTRSSRFSHKLKYSADVARQI